MEGLLDKNEAAKVLDLHPRTVTNKAARGEIRGIRRTGRKEWYFRPDDLEAYKASQQPREP